MLLEADKSAAYISSKNDQLTPLHLAIQQRNIDIIKELILQCPDSTELVDHQERNVLHLAADTYFRDIWSFLLKNPAIQKLIKDKDDEGNTPLHVLAAANPTSFFDGIVRHPLPGVLDENEVNNENKTALDVSLETQSGQVYLEIYIFILQVLLPKLGNWKRSSRKSINRKIKGFFQLYVSELYAARESHLLVATLIATVTFAAGFTMPGGYNSEEGDPGRGLAILSKKSAFKAFIITDTIAMVLSTSAVFLHFLLAMTASSNLSPTKSSNLVVLAFILTMYAMEAMIIAFAAGTYSVLGNSSALSITIIIISLLFFLFSVPAFMIKLYLNK
nr:protein ACCELERATED CELL DEATH 6-like [Ziziphus jujuba var. spinosa]